MYIKDDLHLPPHSEEDRLLNLTLESVQYSILADTQSRDIKLKLLDWYIPIDYTECDWNNRNNILLKPTEFLYCYSTVQKSRTNFASKMGFRFRDSLKHVQTYI